MQVVYQSIFSGSFIVPACRGWRLTIALSKGVQIGGEEMAEMSYRWQYHRGFDSALNVNAKRGSFFSICADADPYDTNTTDEIFLGPLPVASAYFLCVLTNERLTDLHAALMPVLVQMALQADSYDPFPVSFQILRKTYMFIETMTDPDTVDQPHKLPVAGNTFLQACQCLYGKSFKQLRYEWTLKTALNELQLSDKTIHMIQDGAGYADPRSFQKAFRHMFGITPEALRRC